MVGERYANKGVRSTAYQKKLILKDGGTLRTLGSSLEGRWYLKDLRFINGWTVVPEGLRVRF